MPRISFTPQGIIRDIPAWELGNEQVWTEGKNVVFRNGLAQGASNGNEVYGTPLDPPVYLQSSITFDLNAWIYPSEGIAQSINVTDGTTHKEITPAAFLPWQPDINAHTQGNVSGFPFLNWQTQSAHWDRNFVVPNLMTLQANAPLCKAMRSHNNRLIAINTSDDATTPNTEETIRWSSLPDPVDTFPDVWAPAIDNSAGSAQLSGGGPLIDGASIRSSFVIAGQDRLWIMDEVGGSFVFSIRKISSTTGVLARNCIASAPPGLFILSGDDITIFDGTNQKSIIDNQNKVWFFSQLGDNFQNSFVALYAARSEVWFCIPTGSSNRCQLALVYDMGTHKWGHRELNDVAFATTGPVPFPATADASWDGQTDSWNTISRVWNQAVLQSAVAGLVLAMPEVDPRFVSMDGLVDGAPGKVYRTFFSVEKQDMDLGDPSRMKMVKRIWPRFDRVEQTNFMRLSIGGRDELDGRTLSYQPRVLTFNTRDDIKADVFVTHRYISFRLDHFVDDIGNFSLTGFDLEFEFVGRF